MSTLNKNPDSFAASRPKSGVNPKIRGAAITGLWFLTALVSFDAAINRLFPSDPLNTSPGAVKLYFDYGRSTEAKISRQLGATDQTSAPIARAGWLDDMQNSAKLSSSTAAQHHLIALYGMSFVQHVGEAMQAVDPSLELRMLLGPAAPPNHSFAAYQRDRGQQADVVIFGILASSVKAMDAMSGMTWTTDFPPPFTFPKYQVQNSQLEATMPLVNSLPQLRQAEQNPQQWQAFVAQLQQHDRFFDPFTFHHNWLDNSAIVRLLRRSWAKNHQDQVMRQIHDQNGFKSDWQQAAVLKQMVQEFAATARQDGKLPIVLLFNDRGYADHLYQLLQPTLAAANIPYVSTHEIAPATDGRNFVSDGHFTKEVDQKIAVKVLDLMQQHSLPVASRQANPQP
jgi:hypothetical protein